MTVYANSHHMPPGLRTMASSPAPVVRWVVDMLPPEHACRSRSQRSSVSAVDPRTSGFSEIAETVRSAGRPFAGNRAAVA